MRPVNLLKTVQDVISYCNHIHTLNNCVINNSDILNLLEITSWPQNLIINLLGASLKLKTQIIKQSHREYQSGKNIVLICSLSISSSLFHMLIQIATNVTFIKSRIYDNNKRYETMLVWFVH